MEKPEIGEKRVFWINRKVWKGLALDQKVSLVLISFFLVILPVAIIVSLSPIKSLIGRAEIPATPPITPTTTLPPTPTAAPSIFGKSIKLDGVSSYLGVANSDNINAKLGFTIEVWIKPAQTVFPSKAIFNKYIQPGNLNSPTLYFSSYPTPDGGYNLGYQFVVRNANTSCGTESVLYNQYVSGSNTAQITAWKHVAGVIQTDGTISLFVNGTRVGNPAGAADVCSGSGEVTVGALKENSGIFALFNGNMDEFRISDIARYSASFTPPGTPFVGDSHTVVLYHFDGNTANFNQDNHYGINYGNYLAFEDSTVPARVTPTPTASPTATLTPTPMVILNSASGKTCNVLCSNQGLKCQSVGTDASAGNGSEWISSRNSCSESVADCGTNLKKSANRVCSGTQQPWTYCSCI